MVFKRTLLSLSLKSMLVAVGFAQNALLARWMSPHEFGAYTVAFTICLIAGGVATLGQHIAVLRFWPEYVQAGRHALARGVLEFSCFMTLVGSIAVLGVFYVMVWGLNASFDNMFLYLIPAGPLIIGWAFSEVMMSTLQAQGYLFWSTVPRDLLWRIGVVVAAWLILTVSKSVDATSLLLASACVLLILVSAQYSIARHTSILQNKKPQFDQDRWLRATQRWSAAAVVSVTIGQIDTPIVGFMLDHESAGAYFVVQRTALLLTLPLTAINVFYGPQFSALYQSRQITELQKVTMWTSIMLFALAAPAFVVMQLWPGLILSLYGAPYSTFGDVLRILSFGYLVDVLAGPVAIILLLSDREEQYTRIIFFACLFRIAALVTAGLFDSLTGVAFASMASQLLMIALLWRAVRKSIPIEPSILAPLAVLRRSRRLQRS